MAAFFGQLNYYGQDNGSAEGRDKGKRGGATTGTDGAAVGALNIEAAEKKNVMAFAFITARTA